MIVNLKHFKEQWSTIPSFGTTYLYTSSPNPRKVLLALTAVQLWLQLLSLLLLLISYLDQWYFTKDYNANLTDVFAEYGKANFIGSMILHAVDIVVTMFASCHLRNASTKYNYLQEISTWKVLNNIYLMTSIMCFVYIFSNSRSLVICLRVIITCMFTAIKVYIVYDMYKNEKSSSFVLEQNAVLIESSPRPTNNENLKSPESNHSHAVMVELETTVDTPEVKEDTDTKASTTVSENGITQ